MLCTLTKVTKSLEMCCYTTLLHKARE